MNYNFIDPEYLESVTGNDISVITEIVNMFKCQIAEFHEEMKLLYSKNEYRELGLLAHKAKSSVAIMGMSALADMLKAFELSAKESRNAETYEAYIDRFYADTQAAVSELNDYLSKK
ncbi:MAG: Hpt domain-containing protein [Bacteroidales bacterium]|jgi:HPt (histidine-containing phosphotransfer) domain-containing protein|nr:Hpt domain-containing protein [Bacteroidales bacterium]